jgi:hypothetical protein
MTAQILGIAYSLGLIDLKRGSIDGIKTKNSRNN